MQVVRDDTGASAILAMVLKIRLAQPFYGFALVDKDGFPVGALAFTNYSGPNVELSICVGKRLTLGAVREIARVAFVMMKVRRITVHTKASNVRAQHACEALGFRSEGRAKDYYEDDDALVYALLASEQRLIKV